MEKYSILLVEDDDTTREQLARAIRKEGYDVLTAENGRAGLDLFKKEHPKIVVTDLKMPEINGLELMRAVKGLSADVQIILITAFGETDTAVSAIREGALDYLKKPIDLDELSIALGRAKEKLNQYSKAESFPALIIADDEDKIRERLVKEMRKEGWKVFPAVNGEEAILIFQKNKIDIVLLDIKMPKKNGLEALHEMRRISDDFEAIILTGYTDERSAVQALRDGAFNFLKKPIDLDQMIIVVERAMEKLTSQRSLRYRIRELELAQQIVATVTAENKLSIQIHNNVGETTVNFIDELLNKLPVSLFVFDEDSKILYMNHDLARKIGSQTEKLDEQFVKSLTQVGIKDITYESLLSTANRIIKSELGVIETVSAGKYSHIILASLKISRDGETKNHVLAILRGERR